MLNHISIIGHIINKPVEIKPASPALHFIITTVKDKETFYFDIYVKRNISQYQETLKKGCQVVIKGRLIQTKSRINVVILAHIVHILYTPDTSEKQMSLIPDSYFDELEKVNINKNQIELTPEQQKEVQKIKNSLKNW